MTTGYPHANGIHSEVHDLLHPNMKCNPLNNYPVNVKDATAAVLLKGLNQKTPPPKPKSAKMCPNFFLKKRHNFGLKRHNFKSV